MRKFITVLLVTAFAAAPAYAQSKKELFATDVALAERIARLESRMLTGDPAAEQLMQRMDALEAEQRSLTGELEQLRYERDNLRAEIVALGEDLKSFEALEERLRLHLNAVDMVAQQPSVVQSQPVTIYDGSPNAGNVGTYDLNQPSSLPSVPMTKELEYPVGSFPGQGSPQVTANNPDVDVLPELGKQKLYEGNFSGAQTDFQTYLAVMPDAPNAGEVNYWLGETYFVKGSYANAADAYIESMRKDAQGIKAPEALIRLAASLRELGNKTEACQALDSFPVQYPNAAANIREKARIEVSRTGC